MADETHATINKVNLSYVWKIQYDMLKAKNVGCPVRRQFSVDCFDLKWLLEIFPKGVNVLDESHTALLIYLKGSNKFPVIADITFCLLNSAGIKCNSYNFNNTFTNTTTAAGPYEFILFSDLSSKKFVVNDNVTVVCDISVQTRFTDASTKDIARSDNSSSDTLSRDLEKIMKDLNSSDVTLTVCGQKLSAHKVILSARSPVFAKLFNANMKENINNEINIDDVELDVFKEMLRFIYTDRVKNLPKLAYELFALADKYELIDLANICGSVLCENLTVDNAIDIFALLDRHSARELRKEVLEYIVSHIKSIVSSNKFQTFEKTNTPLAMEILRSAVMR